MKCLVLLLITLAVAKSLPLGRNAKTTSSSKSSKYWQLFPSFLSSLKFRLNKCFKNSYKMCRSICVHDRSIVKKKGAGRVKLIFTWQIFRVLIDLKLAVYISQWPVFFSRLNHQLSLASVFVCGITPVNVLLLTSAA